MTRMVPGPCVVALFVLLCLGSVQAEDESPGAVLYRDHCASCHGAKGEGVISEHPVPLLGDRSIRELSKYIDETMPKGDADSLNAEQSALIADFIYEAFYSPTAQFRNQPARVELSRLTTRQYRHSVMDLISDLRWRADAPNTRGLKAEYPEFLKPRVGEAPADKIDPVIDHVFNPPPPAPEPMTEEEKKAAEANKDKKPGEAFRANWRGAIIVPDDGTYEFIVECENGFRLFVNDTRTALLDYGVRSGKETRFSEQIQLLGGRTYPVRLEFNKTKSEKSASVRLLWKRPGLAEELVSSKYLTPDQPPERLVINTPFPPDDRSMGYERGSTISKEWDDATTSAALEAADWVAQRRLQLSGARPDAEDRKEKMRVMCRRILEGAFRRPLTEAELKVYLEQQFEQGEDEENIVKRVVLLALKSPWFLYSELAQVSSDPYVIASRISYALWDSGPDAPLLEAAKKGELASREKAQAQINRMVNNPRTRSKLALFLQQWLRIDRFGDLSKDEKQYPGFTPELISDLRTSLELFLEDVTSSQTADYRVLMTSSDMYLNGRLAAFYGVDLPADAPFQKVDMSKEPRAGVVSHPYLLSGFAYHDQTSPIHRGVFISRSLLGRMLRSPPIAVPPVAPDLQPGLTTRERTHLQTSPEMCQSCHVLINSLGFSLENFDAVGRLREIEKDKPVDTSGEYLSMTGDSVPFKDIRELSVFLANGPEASMAFSSQLFHSIVKQPLRAYGADQPEKLHKYFVSKNYNIRELLGEVALTAAFDLVVPEGLTSEQASTASPSTGP